MVATHLLRQRAHAKGKHQREGQRADIRAYPPNGEPWGQKGWVPAAGGAPGGQPTPTITALTPATSAIGAVPRDVVITGTNFNASVEVWNKSTGTKLATKSFVAAPLSITFTFTVAGTAGSSQQIVINQDGVESAAKLFAWTATAVFDVGENTVAATQDYVNGLGDPESPDVQAEIQRLLDAERAGQNRSTLVAWLDARLGAV